MEALSEITNIGISRAARHLSVLLDDNIHITAPELEITGPAGASDKLGIDHLEYIASVRQGLEGPVSGNAFLILHTEENRKLVANLIGTVAGLTGVDLRKYEHEAIMEIGNIIISSMIAVMADMLDTEIRLSVPAYSEKNLEQLFAENLFDKSPGREQLLIVKTLLRADRRSIHGDMILLLMITNLDDLFNRMERLLGKQTAN